VFSTPCGSVRCRSRIQNELRLAAKEAVSPDYFRTLGIPLLAGRSFDERDTETAEPVVIINETFARRFFPNENPIGQQPAAHQQNESHSHLSADNVNPGSRRKTRVAYRRS
jgi:hypothetical protein